MSSYGPVVMSTMRNETFDRQIDRMLDEALRAFGSAGQGWAPACNAWDDENGFYVQAALPGWEAGHISIEVNNRILTVKGERKEEEGREAGRYHLQEISAGTFERVFKLPDFVDHDKASASHKNGLLTITFPKREEAKPRRILIDVQ